MINMKMFSSVEDLSKLTGLPTDNGNKALWDAGFDLDDWDVGFQCDKPLVNATGEGEDTWCEPASDECHWLVYVMDIYCCVFREYEYDSKYYYMVYHA